MSSDWTLRYYREGDEQGMLDCINAAFGSWPSVDLQVLPIEHLRWKLGPAVDGRRYHIIAESGGRIISCGLVRACQVKLDDQILPACFYGDMAVHADFQNRGVMGAVYDYQDEVSQVFALSIGISDNKFVGKERRKRTRASTIANHVQVLESSTNSPHPGIAEAIVISSPDRFDERIDAFCAEALHPFRFAMARDAGWLNYRYADERAGRYTIRIAIDDDAIVGYAVLTEARGKGFIADLLVDPAAPDALGALLNDANSHFASRGVERIRCWLTTNHPYRSALEQHCYSTLREPGLIKAGPFGDTDLRFLFDDVHAAVHYMAGDTDVV